MSVKGATWTPEDPEEFVSLLEQGWSRTALANHYSVGRDTVRKYLTKIGRTQPAGAFWPGAARGIRKSAAPEADTKGLQEFRDQMFADISQDTKQRDAKRPALPRPVADAHAREFCIFDAHLGKYAWAAETGTDYDSSIAEQCVREAVADLSEQTEGYRCEETILPVGNDLLHTDNYEGTTTAGTHLDRDTRYQLMFRRARGLVSWMIAVAAEHSKVRVVIIPGNHDSLSAWTLGEVLAAEYANDSRVTFDGTPRKRKYVLYGQNLIGYAHGHNEPHKRLPEIMAAEVPQLWSASTSREWHVGHFHRSKVTQPIYVDDHAGCTVRVLRSLSGTDSWHAAQGYVGGVRGAEAFVWRKSGGLRAQFHHTVPGGK